MILKQERKLWHVVGIVGLLLGLAMMIGAVGMLINFDDPLDKTPSHIEAIGVGVALCGVAALVLARLLGVLAGRENEPSVTWTAVCYGSIVLGGLSGMFLGLLAFNAIRSGVQEGLSQWQKVGLLGTSFLVMAGVISFIGERTARAHIKQKLLRVGSASSASTGT